MLQLSLDFLGQTLRRLSPPPSKRPQENDVVAWRHGISVHIVSHPRARRYLLRVQSDGAARLVIPRRGSRLGALQFLDRSEAWLLRKRAEWLKATTTRPSRWSEGVSFSFRGETVTLRLDRHDGLRLRFADQVVRVAHEAEDYRAVVEKHLRRLAEAELPERTRVLAAVHGISICRVTVRAQRTRWGSCSVRGTISLNWRLIQAPRAVVDYLIIHELMHCREMNHSARFWKHVERACPDYRQAEAWLKKFRLE